jgi:hypothetical protein
MKHGSRKEGLPYQRAASEGNPWPPFRHAGRPRPASNIAIQDICPGRYVEHIQAVYDAVYYAVVMDALTHPGAADPSRIDRSVCLQGAMPGVDSAQAAAQSAEIDQDLLVLTGEHHVNSEPRLATYAG